MYEYTLVINSEMSVSVSAFPGMLNVAHLKKNMLSSKKSVLIDMYTEILRIYPCMYLSIEDEMLKNVFKYLYKYETVFYLEAILLTCR